MNISSHCILWRREVAGAENARADLFEGRAWIAITDSFFDAKNKEIAQELVDICGGVLFIG